MFSSLSAAYARLPTQRVQAFRASLNQRPFFRGVSIMLGGTVLGQAASVLLSPALTRLFDPHDFGVLGVYAAILSISCVMASLRYEMAIPLTVTLEDAANLAAVCLTVLTLTTAGVGALAYSVPARVLDLAWLTPLSRWRFLFPLGFGCIGVYFIALYFATRERAFPAIARTRISQGLIGPLSQVGLGLIHAGSPGLAVGFILSQSAGIVGLFYQVLAGRLDLLRAISFNRMKALAHRYRRFPMIASWAALIDAAGTNQILYFLVSTTYSARIAGYIFLAERVVARPLLMLGTSLLQVFIAEAGKTARTDPASLRRRFLQVTSRQFVIALVWIVLANLIALFAFGPLFGENWVGATRFLQALSIAYLAQAVVLPVFHTLQLLERQALAAVWQVGRLVLVVTAFFGSSRLGISPPLVVLCYATAQAAASAALYGLMRRSIMQLQAPEPASV